MLPDDVATRVRDCTQYGPIHLLELLCDPQPEVRKPAVEHWCALDERASPDCASPTRSTGTAGSAELPLMAAVAQPQ